MLIDITLAITPAMVANAQKAEGKALVGHLGTHFDVMDKVFPLEYTQRDGIVFDVSQVTGRDIDLDDVDLFQVKQGMFVAFYTGFVEQTGYGGREYFANHPQLSLPLLDGLLAQEVSIIGIDFAGVRRGREHSPMDQRCADRGTFIVENLCNLRQVLERGGRFTACTYPMNYVGMTGLPCRIIARMPE